MITTEELEYRSKNNLCVYCGEPFSSSNVHTHAGWAETRISGACENCFDGMFEENEK